MRNSTTPQTLGSAEPPANSPKSWSKVSRTRCSRTAHASTSGSLAPGAAILTQTMSCPAAASATTAAPGKFSFARKRISGRAREYLLGTQRVARIGQARNDVVMRHIGVVCQDLGFVPSVGHQSDHELDGKARAADDRLASQHFRVERNARMLSHNGSTVSASSGLRFYPIQPLFAMPASFGAHGGVCSAVASRHDLADATVCA